MIEYRKRKERESDAMERIVLSPLPVKLDAAALMEANHIPADSDLAEEFNGLVDAAQRVLCCKAILLEADPAALSLPSGLKPRYFYAMTVGTEIEAEEDCDYPYLGDVVRQAALDAAMAAVQDHLKSRLGLRSVQYHNPGSTEGWEQLQNVSLFQLLQGEEIGLACDGRGNLTPWYSTLGVFTED